MIKGFKVEKRYNLTYKKTMHEQLIKSKGKEGKNKREKKQTNIGKRLIKMI